MNICVNVLLPTSMILLTLISFIISDSLMVYVGQGANSIVLTLKKTFSGNLNEEVASTKCFFALEASRFF